MDQIKDGGQAFPLTVTLSTDDHEHLAYPGMTLRDYFAAKAMAALLTNNWPVGLETTESAYTMADCMLKTREAA
ncbi:hypothetical protein [Paraburkholderia xenovorans]|uniref:hypothetical protein n=1 Tax=Paraburkholderia xenovorans TaxID=36873 RepID=UPI0038BB7C5A